MEEHVKRVLSNLEHARDEVVANLDHTIHVAEEIVEAGGEGMEHHDVPANLRVLPFQTSHCPLSGSPLYLPPSVERQQGSLLLDLGREVIRCFRTRASKVKNRSLSDMEEFAKPRAEGDN